MFQQVIPSLEYCVYLNTNWTQEKGNGAIEGHSSHEPVGGITR